MGVPKVRKESRKRFKQVSKNPFSDFLGLFGLLGPRLFRDFFETFWLLVPRASLSQVHGTSKLGCARDLCGAQSAHNLCRHAAHLERGPILIPELTPLAHRQRTPRISTLSCFTANECLLLLLLVAHRCCDPCRATQCHAHSVAASPAILQMSRGCPTTPLQPSQKRPFAAILPPP